MPAPTHPAFDGLRRHVGDLQIAAERRRVEARAHEALACVGRLRPQLLLDAEELVVLRQPLPCPERCAALLNKRPEVVFTPSPQVASISSKSGQSWSNAAHPIEFGGQDSFEQLSSFWSKSVGFRLTPGRLWRISAPDLADLGRPLVKCGSQLWPNSGPNVAEVDPCGQSAPHSAELCRIRSLSDRFQAKMSRFRSRHHSDVCLGGLLHRAPYGGAGPPPRSLEGRSEFPPQMAAQGSQFEDSWCL